MRPGNCDGTLLPAGRDRATILLGDGRHRPGEWPLFAAHGDETRLALVARLCSGGPQSILRLATGAAVTRQAITKHLTVLAAAGGRARGWHGRERIWAIEADRVDEAYGKLDQISQQWDEALGRLKTFVEE